MEPRDRERHRLLVIDDNESIHDDLRKILAPAGGDDHAMDEAEELLFGVRRARCCGFEIDSAYQGQEGLKLLEAAWEEKRPYALAFVDVRMPPGWDGIETTTHLWRCDPDLQVVICTAYTDYSWREIVERLGESHNLVILKKPFDNIEVVQLAHALTSKRDAMEAAKSRLQAVENEVRQRRQAERELMDALDAAREADRCKRDFLATMSHELRTPLNAIIGYTEMLEEDAVKEGAAKLLGGLGKVRSAGKHLLALINDVLDMARIEAGRMPIEPRAVGVGKLAREVAAMVAPLAEKNRNRIAVSIEDEDLAVEVDETRFEQCLLNLLGNACKFTTAGLITLEVRRPAGEEKVVAFEVRDTGIGISSEQAAKLFEPFTQVDSAVNRRFGGSGLGLAITQRLCELMGGSIEVESRLGEGSLFTIRIPRAAEWPPRSGTGETGEVNGRTHA